MDNQEIADKIAEEVKKLLGKETDSERMLLTVRIARIKTKTVIEVVKMTPKLPPRLASEELEQVAKQSHWDIILDEKFKSIRIDALAKAGIELIAMMNLDAKKQIKAGAIIELFKKYDIPLYNGGAFHTELGKINHVLKSKYQCTIMRADKGDFSTKLERTFALFYQKTTVQQ